MVVYEIEFITADLEQHRFELYGSAYTQIFFNKYEYTVYRPYPQILHPQIQPAVDQKQYFGSAVGNLQMLRANYMHSSMPFSIRDSSISHFI